MAALTPIWLVGGERGGVGKSTCAHLLLDYLRVRLGYRIIVVETDRLNADVGRVFEGKETADVVMHPLRFDTMDEWISLVDLMEDSPDAAVLINGAAQLFFALETGRQYMQEGGGTDREWVHWFVMGRDIESVNLLKRYVEMIGELTERQRLVVIESAGLSGEREFKHWRQSNLYVTLRKKACPIAKVSFLALSVGDEMRGQQWSISEARKGMRFAARIELERWRNAAFTSIARALGDG